jgi:hypothetical protein
MKNKDPGIDHWGTPYLHVPLLEKNILALLVDITSTFCYLLVKQDLKQSPDTHQIP